MQKNKGIFISYKNDVAGNSFAARLCADFEKKGYDVYYNPNEQHAGDFPNRLQEAIESCTDFLLILTKSCLDQLMRHEKIDWVREELIIANNSGKNIIPLLTPGVSMPKDKDEMPEDLRFLPDKDAISMFEPYDKSPFESLLDWIITKPAKKYVHKDTYNSNITRNIDDDFKAAKELSDDPNALYELANMYYYGLVGNDCGCERDYERAYQMLEKLNFSNSVYGDLVANSMKGEMYYHGLIPRETQSYQNALYCHERAKSVSGFSAREAAYLRSRGCGCEFDYDSIVNSYSEAIDQGDNIAIVGLASFYMNYGKFNEAADLYRRTCNFFPDAEFQLGMLYRKGVLETPPKPDFFKAAFYFQHAISSGNCSSEVYHQLGRLYFTPVGDFPKDFREAEKNFKIAADIGNKEAQYKLGLMYEYGYVQLDIEKAIYYHSLAEAQGISFSSYHLALLYQNPKVKNYQEAFNHAEIAARNGVMEGEFLLGIFLFYGRGCIADENRAYKYLKKAYNHGMCAAGVFLNKINGDFWELK